MLPIFGGAIEWECVYMFVFILYMASFADSNNINVAIKSRVRGCSYVSLSSAALTVPRVLSNPHVSAYHIQTPREIERS